jgi:hypothetical protein
MKKHQSKDNNTSTRNRKTNKKVCGFANKNPTHKKNIDNVKLLFSYKPFKEDLKKIRESLHIPENGFVDDEAAQSWEVSTDMVCDQIMNSPEFLNQEQKIIEKIKNGEISQEIGNKQMHLFYSKVMCNYFTNSINFIIEKYHIPYNYEQTLRHYIVLNEILFAPAQNYAITKYLFNNKIKQSEPLTINMYAKLTNEEIKQLKKSIARFGKNLPKFQPLKNINERLKLEKIMKNRGYFDEVEFEECEHSISNIALDFFGNKNKDYYGYVSGSVFFSSNALHRMKDLLQQKGGYKFSMLIRIAPYEGQWYGEYVLQHEKFIPTHGLFILIDNAEQCFPENAGSSRAFRPA